MSLIIAIFAIYGLAHAIKETDGPWNIIGRWRNLMMRIPFIGVQFFKLLDCYFCLGFHCGWIVYLLAEQDCSWQFFILWGLAGSSLSIILNALLMKLTSSSN